MTIVVTGATGHLGRLVVESLLRRGASPGEVVATGRNTEHLAELAEQLGVRTAVADYADPATLRAAFDGADRVLLVSGTEMGQRVAQHTAVVQAAREAGVELLAYTSIPHADTAQMALATEHRETERVIRESGVPFTFLRNSWYFENYLAADPHLPRARRGRCGRRRPDQRRRPGRTTPMLRRPRCSTPPRRAACTSSAVPRSPSPSLLPRWPRSRAARSPTPRSRPRS